MMQNSMGALVLVRHGESRWNQCNRFTGWVDVPLSENGIKEAQGCAEHCKRFQFDSAFTSDLERARQTLLIILSLQGHTAIVQHPEDSRYRRWTRLSNRCGGNDIPVFTSPLLNERFYGALQGLEKSAAERRFGKENIFQWRRGFTDRPPDGETLKETFKRVHPYFVRRILPRVRRGETVFLAGHGNTLRGIIKYLENIGDEDVVFLDLPHGHPLVYTFRRGHFIRTEGELKFNRPLR